MKKSKSKRSSVSWTQAVGFFLLLLAAYSFISIITFTPSDHAFFVSSPNNPVHNKGGIWGASLAFFLRFWFGSSMYLLPILFLIWAGCFFAEQIPRDRFIKGASLLLLLCASSTLFSLSWQSETRFDAGGMIGYFFSMRLEHYCGLGGSYLIAIFSILIALTVSTDFLLAPWIRQAGLGVVERVSAFVEKLSALRPVKIPVVPPLIKQTKNKLATPPPRAGQTLEEHVYIPPKVREYQPALDVAAQEKTKSSERKTTKSTSPESSAKSESAAPIKTPKTPSIEKSTVKEETAVPHEPLTGRLRVRSEQYDFPPLDLLTPPSHKGGGSGSDFKQNSKILETTLRNFGIDVRVTEIEQGPVITRYELLPAPGVKVQSISALENDLALALRAKSIRILAPIPGKAAVGIEIPNSESHTVCLREMVTAEQVKAKHPRIPLLLGRDTSGKPMISDLCEMPHILIAGTTGSGKTVCLNAVIGGMLYFLSPDDLKFIMIDPKMVELATYNGLPHMLAPVVTEPKKAAATLNWVVSEMESRYKLLAERGVRNIHAFNVAAAEKGFSSGKESSENTAKEGSTTVDHMPYIVVIIDELADLMMIAQDKVETAIARLAQLSRAVGIHLILATQRPSVDVITGVIKANFPARLSFKVASKIDSRTVLDANGADQLLGRGDMLFLEPGEPEPKRGQAPWVSDEEIGRIVEFYKKKAEPEYVTAIQEIQQSGSSGGDTVFEKDEIYDEAVRVVLDTGVASVSHLQRRLRLGYSRAARILDTMEAEGIVGPSQGSKPREIFRKPTASI